MALGISGTAALTFLLLQANLLLGSPAEEVSTIDQAEAPPPVTCPAGAPIGPVDLEVRSQKTAETLPLQSILHLSEGDTLVYHPLLRNKEKRPGEVSLVMVPARKTPDTPPLIVTNPQPAGKDLEWSIPQTISLAAFVYGPGGLSRKKVEGFLSQDDQLVAQLADYAEKTTQTEALLAALSENSTSAGMNAALSGFASQYGLAVQIDKTAPPSAQAQTLFATMNPQLATYNPLSSSTGERLGQTASLATAAATLFFGSPIGLAAGGTAMLMDLRYIAFPNTVFRSSFAQPLPAKTGVNLCGQRGALPAHARAAYIWAVRIPNAPIPQLKVKEGNFIPQTLKTSVPVEAPDLEWKYLQRARSWMLTGAGGRSVPVSVTKLGNQHALEIGLEKSDVAPGDYTLSAFWDWRRFEVKGSINVRPLSSFKGAHLQPASQDALLAKSGKIAVTLAGSDFEFTGKVQLKKAGDEFAVAEATPFILPLGPHKGPQERMDVQIDTTNLDAGSYQLLIAQDDGKPIPVPLSILPGLPKVENLPVLLNEGGEAQHFVLKGERLQLIAKLDSPVADFQLLEASRSGTERNLIVQLKQAAKTGTTLPVTAVLSDRSAPLVWPDAIQITGPLPAIASSRLSLPGGLEVALLPGEFPAGSTLTALLDVKNIQPRSILQLYCSEGTGAHPALHIGEQSTVSSLQRLSPDQLFVSYDTSAFPAGCSLAAQIDNGLSGKSQPFELAHIIRLPKVLSFAQTAGEPNSPLKSFELRGFNLEMIEKAGWDGATGIEVSGLPVPIAGQGQQQSLIISLPEPMGVKPVLYLWLRGESTGRSTTICLTPGTNCSTPGTLPAPH